MNIDDFCFMRCGKVVQPLMKGEVSLLAPIDIRGQGKGRALLLLHGFGSSPAVFRELIPALHRYDALVCPLLPGHGESLATFSAVKSMDWLTAAEQACENLLKDYQKVDVLGLSLGGLLAYQLSQRFSLNHLFLLAPALALRINTNFALSSAFLLHALGLQRIQNRAGNLYSPKHSELAYRQLPLTTIMEILRLVKNVQLNPPRCPTELFLGHFDEVVHSGKLASYFEGIERTRIHWLKKSAHVLPLDGDVDLILDVIHKT